MFHKYLKGILEQKTKVPIPDKYFTYNPVNLKVITENRTHYFI